MFVSILQGPDYWKISWWKCLGRVQYKKLIFKTHLWFSWKSRWSCSKLVEVQSRQALTSNYKADDKWRQGRLLPIKCKNLKRARNKKKISQTCLGTTHTSWYARSKGLGVWGYIFNDSNQTKHILRGHELSISRGFFASETIFFFGSSTHLPSHLLQPKLVTWKGPFLSNKPHTLALAWWSDWDALQVSNTLLCWFFNCFWSWRSELFYV